MLKVGVQTSGWYQSDDPIGSFSYIRSCGFEAVDFNIDHYLPVKNLMNTDGPYPSFFDQDIEDILAHFAPLRAASLASGVEICQAHAPFPVWMEGKEELNEKIMSALEKCLLVCEAIGCPALVVHPVKCATPEEEWERNLSLYRHLLPTAQKTGVKICLENLFTRRPQRIYAAHLSAVSEACRMIDLLNKEAGRDLFGFCFDVGHANICNVDARSYIKALGHRLTILHIHDNDATEDLHMIPYSYLATSESPSCDWDGFVTALGEIDYQGVLCFETFRIFSAYPKATHTAALQLISAIGRDWATRLAGQ